MKFFWSLGCSDKAAVLAGESVPVRFVDFLETGAGRLGRDGATVESSAEKNSRARFVLICAKVARHVGAVIVREILRPDGNFPSLSSGN